MYCKIIPLEMDGGDHVMLIILPTNVTNAFCTDEGAKLIKLVLIQYDILIIHMQYKPAFGKFSAMFSLIPAGSANVSFPLKPY